MSKRYAVIENGIVTNVALWDGATDWTDSDAAHLLPDDSPVGPGFAFDGTNFIAPSLPPPPTYSF